MKVVFVLCLLLPTLFAFSLPSFEAALTAKRQGTPARCSWTDFYAKAGLVRDGITAVSEADDFADFWSRLSNAFMQVDEYFTCFDAEPNKPLIIREGSEQVTITDTTECPDLYKPDHPEDPCCYPRKLTDMCCAPRTITYTDPEKFQGFIEDGVDTHCRNPNKIKPFINHIQRHLEFVDKGFCKVFLPSAEDINEYFKPLAYCIHNVLGYGDAGKCSSDAGCFTQNCQRGRCVPDLRDLATPTIQCLTVGVPADIERRLRREWGLTHSNTALEFHARFVQEFAADGCIDLGADGDAVNLPTTEGDCLNVRECDCQVDGVDRCVAGNNCYLPVGQLYGNTMDDRTVCLAANTTNGQCPPRICSNHHIDALVCEDEDHCDRPCAGDQICADEASCIAGGTCDDDELRDGVCVLDWIEDNEGNVFACANGDRSIRRGCVREGVDESGCGAINGVWVTRATTEAECRAHGEICREGEMRPFYNWRPNIWGRGRFWDLVEKAGEDASIYRWDTKLDDTKLGQVWGRAIARHIGQHYRVYLGCVMGPLIPTAALVACDCFDMADRPQECFNNNVVDPNVDGGSAIVFALVAGCIRSASAKICWVQATVIITDGKDSIILQVTFVNARILIDNRNKRRAELGLRQAAGNEFNVVENDKQEIIGQVVGDEIAVSVDDISLVGGVFNLCFTPDPSIPIDAANDKPGFAVATESMGAPVYDPNLEVTIVDGDYCADISSPGYFTPVNVDSTKAGTPVGSGSGSGSKSAGSRLESAFF